MPEHGEASAQRDESTYESPRHDALVEDLQVIREKGLPKLRTLVIPNMVSASRFVEDDAQADDVVSVENTLRKAVGRLGGGDYGDEASLLFGLVGGTRGMTPTERRRMAGDAVGVSAETVRTRHQADLVSDVASQVLALIADQRRRVVRTQLERRHPAESRLAVEWVERFEAYYRMWTPIYSLAADLTAYRATLLEPDRPYDREPGTNGPEDLGYTQEFQAEGYARFALFGYSSFEWEQRQFMTRYGGLWLLSSHEAETTAEDSLYRIWWHINPLNERDQSWLRGAIQDSRGQEMHGFLQLIKNTSIGNRIHDEWQEWVATCHCTWDLTTSFEQERFPTALHRPSINEECQVHQVVAACETYCDLVENEWGRIADWYHLGSSPARGVSAERLYEEWRQQGSPMMESIRQSSPGSGEWR